MSESKKIRKPSLHEIEGVEKDIASLFPQLNEDKIVSDLLDADMDDILKSGKIDENTLDSVYEAVQNFVEREVVEEIEIYDE